MMVESEHVKIEQVDSTWDSEVARSSTRIIISVVLLAVFGRTLTGRLSLARSRTYGDKSAFGTTDVPDQEDGYLKQNDSMNDRHDA